MSEYCQKFTAMEENLKIFTFDKNFCHFSLKYQNKVLLINNQCQEVLIIF